MKPVAGTVNCGDETDGWYYDNAEQASKITACPQTCDAIKAIDGGTVSSLIGC